MADLQVLQALQRVIRHLETFDYPDFQYAAAVLRAGAGANADTIARLSGLAEAAAICDELAATCDEDMALEKDARFGVYAKKYRKAAAFIRERMAPPEDRHKAMFDKLRKLAREIYEWNSSTQQYAPAWDDLTEGRQAEFIFIASLPTTIRISMGWKTHQEMQEEARKEEKNG